MTGLNRAVISQYESLQKSASKFNYDSVNKPCIFLSHITSDKSIVKEIGDYIKKSDIDIYLDIHDEDLQRAVRLGDSKKITEFLERGLTKSTHIMCFITNNTQNSWWVPYEIGYAKKSDKNIVSLKLKGNIELPSYLQIGTVLEGTTSLNAYLSKLILNKMHKYAHVVKKRDFYDYTTDSLLESIAGNHPLDNYLDWSK